MRLDDIVDWHWWVAGLGLLILEAFVPGAVFLWMGVSALTVGALTLVFPAMGWQAEFIVFGVLALLSFFAWRRLRPTQTASDQPTLNRRADSYVGRQFTLTQPVIDGVGSLHVDDSQWRISGPDLPAGSRVRVVAADGVTLRVEPAG